MVLLVEKVHLEARFGPFGDGAILTQDRCTVCDESTKGSKKFWTHPMEHLGDVGPMESYFGPFGDGVNVGAR
jgi:hypothetical protein